MKTLTEVIKLNKSNINKVKIGKTTISVYKGIVTKSINQKIRYYVLVEDQATFAKMCNNIKADINSSCNDFIYNILKDEPLYIRPVDKTDIANTNEFVYSWTETCSHYQGAIKYEYKTDINIDDVNIDYWNKNDWTTKIL